MSITSVDVFERYDLILDCTDNPASRYLVSDTAVLTGKPLVTASALRTEGQLMVLNSPPNDLKGSDGGPCYRCVFPNPPPADTVIACGEGGILGPVVGVMGVLMALEAIKLLASPGKPKMRTTASMLLYSAYSSPSFRNVRLRGRRKGCMACSVDAKITRDTLATSGSIYYDTFCGTKSPVDLLSHTERITAKDAQTAQHNDSSPLILDVRDATQFGICHLENSINIPYALIESVSYDENRKASTDEHHEAELDILENLRARARDRPLHVICRYGNDSQLAVRRLKQLGFDNGGKRCIGDIKGGLHSWRQEVDPSWPEY
ncbi:Urmylation protein [Varicellaria rhodocarpa]|nr:Urmylation protein [Varicellaria rhodocarpa]